MQQRQTQGDGIRGWEKNMCITVYRNPLHCVTPGHVLKFPNFHCLFDWHKLSPAGPKMANQWVGGSIDLVIPIF